VSGVVLDLNGAPVSGAQVWVAIEPRLNFGSMPVVTGDDGAFRFNVVAGRKYRVHAEQQVTVGERGQSRSARSEPFEASGRMKPFRLVLGGQ
jgi:protocatechuate 3,4-dioxygenase beta subunit